MWRLPDSTIKSIQNDEAHLWRVAIDQHQDQYAAYRKLLTQEELVRADQYRFEKHRICYVVARAVLRLLVGKYIEVDPRDVVFSYIKNGKPLVVNQKGIQFNVSHSENYILIGFVKDYDLGVDVEYTKQPIEVQTIAASFFSKEEVAMLVSLAEEYQTQAFYNCWTRKEAFIKALGDGLSFPLDQFVVSMDSTKVATLLETKWNQKEKQKWSLKSIEVDRDYIGALAAKGQIHKMELLEYKGELY